MPRVVSGKAGGIPLESPKGQSTRPTADKVKEAVFSSLSNKIHGSRFLDIFAGTGQMGIEALSRGAASAFFIDQSRECFALIEKNLKKTRLEESAHIILSDVNRGLSGLKNQDTFDIVYMDPPYDQAISYFHGIAQILSNGNILSADAVVLLEHRVQDAPEAFVMNLKLKKSCKYGTIMVSFYDKVSLENG